MRPEVENVNVYEDTGDERFLLCVWHDQIVMTVFSGRPQNMAALVSPHQDGSFLADAMNMQGIATVRGSSSRGAVRALRKLLGTTRDQHVSITPDGPRGPRREMKSGIIFLASQTGRRIVPIACSCKSYWTIQGNWTDMMLPKPFTTVFASGGRPIEVPANLDRAGIERYAQLVQSEMDRMQTKIQRIVAGQEPDQVIQAAA